jgi:hypothetical protein
MSFDPSPLSKDDIDRVVRQNAQTPPSRKPESDPQTSLRLNEIILQVQKISDLMAHHLIAISEHELIICLLNPQDHNRVQIVTAKRRALDLQTNPSAAPSGSE